MEYFSKEQLIKMDAHRFERNEIIPTPQLKDETQAHFHLVEENDLLPYVPRRTCFSNKGSYGHALLIAGKRGMAGASVLAARSCMRSGVGLLTVHVPAFNIPIVQTAIPEAIIQSDIDECCFTRIDNLLPYSAIGVGPGLGQEKATDDALFRLLEQCQSPLVLDADALNILAAHPESYCKLPQGSVLTPHPKEFERLAGKCDTAACRLSKTLDFAQQYGVVIVLKGRFTVIVTPQRECFFNTTGNAGMATAGSGDVLTGILLALLAQAIPPIQASMLAVYVHGLAGDIAATELGEISMMAGDIVNCLPAAWRRLDRSE